eukprot:6659067-Prorocentrum_lima.AAC.1
MVSDASGPYSCAQVLYEATTFVGYVGVLTGQRRGKVLLRALLGFGLGPWFRMGMGVFPICEPIVI